jgi:hypothetical protein
MFLWAVCMFSTPLSFLSDNLQVLFHSECMQLPRFDFLYSCRARSKPYQNFNIPIQVQPQVFGTFCLISWAQTLIYHEQVISCHKVSSRQLTIVSKWPVWKATSLGVVIWLVLGGAEAALILTLKVTALPHRCSRTQSLTTKPLYDRGISFPMIIVGVIASILLAAGLLPPYVEIYKRRGRVIGINWVCPLNNSVSTLLTGKDISHH